ncbi:MAG: phosphatase PAP2 family protein [Ornithinibacter sp.]
MRRLLTTVCLLVTVLVAWARLHRRMHHQSDILVGAANGVACAARVGISTPKGCQAGVCRGQRP